MLTQLPLIFFSPTKGTRNAIRTMASMIATSTTDVDLSSPSPTFPSFSATDTVLVGAPVFGGRIPTTNAERLLQCQGNGALAISVVCYGNRAYEDALLELNNTLTKAGFTVIASAALITSHSMDRSFGVGRPDEGDNKRMAYFCHDVLNKITTGKHSTPVVPGNIPYKEYIPAPVVPTPLNNCTQCGHCASVCPTQAIDYSNFLVPQPENCIRCVRCIDDCPENARSFPQAFLNKVHEMLSSKASTRQEPEFFI